MVRRGSDKQWEFFGSRDPYYGVCSEDQFRGQDLQGEKRDRFFASGEEQLAELFEDARRLVDPSLDPENVLEYGCGVGRLLIPAARRAAWVVGVDVSPSMLREAQRNCHDAAADNVDLVAADQLDLNAREFDFVYSVAVLQHVPRRAGGKIIDGLAGLLRPGGVGALNLVLGADVRLVGFNAAMKVPLAHNVLNVARGRDWSYPHMQMNVYNLNRVTQILRDRGLRKVYVRLGPRSAGFDPCTVYFAA